MFWAKQTSDADIKNLKNVPVEIPQKSPNDVCFVSKENKACVSIGLNEYHLQKWS